VTVVLASDLDRTLIFSGRFFTDEHGARSTGRVCVERLDGREISFVTARSHAILEELARSGTLLPVTSRTVEQYRRIELPGPPPPFAVCANGGRLLVGGVEDEQYREELVRDLSHTSAPVADVWAILEVAAARRADAGRPLKAMRVADGLFCYTVDETDADPAWAQALAQAVDPLGWGVTRQMRKVYLVPRPLTKARAVRAVAERTRASHIVAAGDAHLDISMLHLADEAIRPAHGELHDEGWSAPRVSVTASQGVMAGQEIAEWLLERHRQHACVRSGQTTR